MDVNGLGKGLIVGGGICIALGMLFARKVGSSESRSERTKPPGPDSDAKFVGWQEKLSGEIFPLFNITVADHPLYQSTVSEATLHRLHLRVPQILSPYPETEPSP
jgi:hypothetical protein